MTLPDTSFLGRKPAIAIIEFVAFGGFLLAPLALLNTLNAAYQQRRRRG